MEEQQMPDDIKQKALWYSTKVSLDGKDTIYNHIKEEAYIEGATTERNRAKEEVEKWKVLAQDMYIWLEMYMETRPSVDNSHPVHGLLKRYQELEKEQ